MLEACDTKTFDWDYVPRARLFTSPNVDYEFSTGSSCIHLPPINRKTNVNGKVVQKNRSNVKERSNRQSMDLRRISMVSVDYLNDRHRNQESDEFELDRLSSRHTLNRSSSLRRKSVARRLMINVGNLPTRRIQSLSVIQKDPLFRFTGRYMDHAMGFKVPEKSISMNVFPDIELLDKVKEMEHCEKLYAKRFDSTHSRNAERKRSDNMKNHVTDQDNLQNSISTFSSLESLSTSSSDDPTVYHCPIRKIPFHLYFDSGVQLYPNQKMPLNQRKQKNRIKNVATTNQLNDNNDNGGCGHNLSNDHNVNMSNRTSINARSRSIRYSRAISKDKRRSTCLAEMFTSQPSSRSSSSTSSFSFNSYISQPLSHQSSVVYSTDDGDFSFGTESYGFAKAHKRRKGRSHSMCGRKSISSRVHPFMKPRLSFLRTGSRRSSILNMKSFIKRMKSKYQYKDDDISDDTSASICDDFSIGLENSSLSQSQSKLIYPCSEIYKAARDPNPFLWFDLLNDHLNSSELQTSDNKLKVGLHLKDLVKRFVSVSGGITGLKAELEKDWEIRPKSKLLSKYFIKNHVLGMPLTVEHADLLKRLYRNAIVRYPLVYKMLLRRRTILSVEIQQFLNRIMELTDTSDKMIASLTMPLWKSTILSQAAVEMDASGLMMGGPKPKDYMMQRMSEVALTKQFDNTEAIDSADVHETDEQPDFDEDDSDRKRSNCIQYGPEIDADKAFYINLRDPCKTILEEVALRFAEFAWHIRPLFERRWAMLEHDLAIRLDDLDSNTVCEASSKVNSKGLNISDIYQSTYCSCFQSSLEKFDSNYNYSWPKTLELTRFLFKSISYDFKATHIYSPGHSIWNNLLICIHMSKYCTHLTNLLISKSDLWMHALIVGLESTYASVREEVCCVLAYLVTYYNLMFRLQHVSRNILVSNLILALFSAIGLNSDSYPFFHGVLGYLLHSLPCISIIDCLLLWIPMISDATTNCLSKDWGVFIYYILKYWPAKILDSVDIGQKKKLLKLLEVGYLKPHSKQSCRLGLSCMIQTWDDIQSPLLTCWRELDEDKMA